MTKMRQIIGPLALLALPLAVACMFRPALGRLGIERVLWVPLLITSLTAFTLAVVINVKIGKSVKAMVLFESTVGMYHALLKAPLGIVAYSAIGLFLTMLFGAEGQATSVIDAPEEVHIAFSVAAAFSAVSLPSLYTRHSAATQ